MQRAVSSSAKCLPVPAPPVSRMTLRAAGASVPSTKGRRMARTTLSTKASCPSTVCLTSAARPSKLPRCSGFTSVVPLASRPSSSMSRSIWRLLSSAAAVASLWVLSWAFCCFNSSSSRFCCSRSAAFRSGRAALPPVLGAEVPGAALNLPPGPNTPFIRLSQSSVYAIKLPSVQCFFFQYSGVWYVLQGKG